jgi:hypothetical protein
MSQPMPVQQAFAPGLPDTQEYEEIPLLLRLKENKVSHDGVRQWTISIAAETASDK